MIQRYGRSPVSGVFCATDEGDYVEYADHVAEMKRVNLVLVNIRDASTLAQFVGAQIMARAILAEEESHGNDEQE